jgi:cytochrome c-type biogenesis protein
MPAYLSFVTGLSMEELSAEEGDPERAGNVFRSAALFVLGFSAIFILIGASAALLGRSVSGVEADLLGLRITPVRVAGVVIVLFGLHLAGVWRISWLYRESRIQVKERRGPLGAVLLGAAFAFGWTPCIGPVLAGILTLAAAEGTVASGTALLSLYSLGLAIPFLVMAASFGRALRWLGRVKRHFRAIEIGSGVLLVGVGLLVMSDRLTALNRSFTFLSEWILAVEQWLL